MYGRAHVPVALGVLSVRRGLLAGVDHRHDVRVVELRHRARLAAEALELVGVRGDLAVHQLDRDRAFEHGVEGPIDGGHAAAPDLGVEAVAPAEQGPEDGHRPLLWARRRRRITTSASAPR